MPSASANGGLDRVGVGHGHDRLARVAGHETTQRGRDAGVHLDERLATREAEPARVALDRAPLGQLGQLLQRPAGPVAELALEQASLDADAHAERTGDRRGRLPGAFERRRVDGCHLVELGDASRGGRGLLAALVRQVEPAGPSGQRRCPWTGSGRGAPAGRWWRGQASAWGIEASWGSLTAPAYVGFRLGEPPKVPVTCGDGSSGRARARDRGVPRLPPTGGLARRGGGDQAGGVPRRGRTGVGRCPGSGIRRPAWS